MNPTERMIDRIKKVEKFNDIAYLCEDFQSFVDEIQEWGVDHICGVDFFGKGFELNPNLDFKLLDEYFSSYGLTKADPHPAGRFAETSSGQSNKLSTNPPHVGFFCYIKRVKRIIHMIDPRFEDEAIAILMEQALCETT